MLGRTDIVLHWLPITFSKFHEMAQLHQNNICFIPSTINTIVDEQVSSSKSYRSGMTNNIFYFYD